MLYFSFLNQTSTRIKNTLFDALFEKGKKVLKKEIQNFIGNYDYELGLILFSDKEIHQLNSRYRGKDTPTDVLSFTYAGNDDFPENPYIPESREMVGEIFISLDTACRQAKEKGHPLEYELQFLFVHGFLHVFGFDHQTDAEAKKMNLSGKKIIGENIA